MDDQTQKKIMIYHHNDEDGWASAAVILQHYPQAELTACFHGEDYPFVEGYDEVFVVDFTFSQEQMTFLKEKNKHFIWIDHHASAMDKVQGEFEGIRQEGTAACVLTWNYFNKGVAEEISQELPEVIAFIGGYDVWDFSKPGTEAFILYLQTLFEKGKEAHQLKEMLDTFTKKDYSSALEKGELLKTYHEKITLKQLNRGVHQDFLGLPAMVFFANFNNSNLGNLALKTFPEIKLAVIIDYVVVQGEPLYKYSLRSRKEDEEGHFNVAKLAETFGGGGHPAAAGFESKERLWDSDKQWDKL